MQNPSQNSIHGKLPWIIILLAFVFTGCPKRAVVQKTDRAKTVTAQRTKPANHQRTPSTPSLTKPSPEAAVRQAERYDQPREAEAFYRMKRLPAGETELPVERYLVAKQQMEQMRQYATSQDQWLPSRAQMKQAGIQPELLATWTPLGPGNIGGRTRAMVIHPTNPSVMYAAGVAGGVWKTINAGASWTPLADMIANIAVNSLALDVTNPNVLYAGTGEGTFGINSVRGAGIFKTIDGGANWTRLAPTNTADFYYVNDLVISPNNNQRLYAATSTGVWRSLDGGSNWTPALPTTVMGGCLDLVIRTDQTSDALLASCGTLAQATVYRNPDAAGSGSWTPVLTESGMGRTSLALAPATQNVIYALASSIASGSYLHGLHAVFRSTDGGATWVAQVRNTNANKLNTAILSYPARLFINGTCQPETTDFTAQAWHTNTIAVDPADANRVWVGGIDLFRSDDAGVNWGIASYWYPDGVYKPRVPQYTHADQMTLVFHPGYNGTSNKTLYVTNDGGVFRTDDARAATATGTNSPCTPDSSAVAWTSLNNSYGVTQFYHGLPYPNGTTYFGGTQDNGTLRGNDTDGPNGWKEIFGGDGGYVAVNPTNTNTLYAENTRLTFSKSTDGGVTFTRATSGIVDSAGNWLFITPFAMDASDPQRLWIGGAYLWRTTDGAANWTRASAFPTSGQRISAIAVAPTDANFVLAGTQDGYIRRTNISLTADSNTAWATARPRPDFVSWVAFDPLNKNLAYATYSTFGGTHVWKSTNAGVSWTGIDGTGTTGIPDLPVHCIVIDPANTQRLFVGTDLGVFVSTDGGATWAVENTGFANVVTESLALNVVNGATQLFAFTHGRGAWRVNTNTTGCNFSLATTGQVFPVSGGAATVNVTADPGSCAWTASSNAPWITVTSGSSGTGNGSVGLTIAANTGAARTGTVAIAGRSFTVTQAGCTYTLSATSRSFEPAGGTGSLDLTTNAGICAWTATSNASFLTITSGSSGTGNGTINYAVAANTTTSSRTGTITIAGQTFSVTQAGCSYALAPTSQTFAATGGTGNVTVTADGGCPWTATSSVGWLAITAGSSGSGNGTVSFSVAANTGLARTSTLTIAGRTFTASQMQNSVAVGELDPSFGNAGKVTTDFGRDSTFDSSYDNATSVVLQPDSKIVAAGYHEGSKTSFALARYLSNGSLDTTFGTEGKVRTFFASGESDTARANAVVLQPDGKIVALGGGFTSGSPIVFMLVRYQTDGTLDTSFGNQGKVTTGFTTGASGNALLLQPDGKLIALGYDRPSSGSSAFALARYLSNGSLDSTFGTGGKVTTAVGGLGAVRGAVLQPDGKILAVGESLGSSQDFAVVRYHTNGSLDTSFGVGGKVTTDFGNQLSEIAYAVALQADGKIVVVGSNNSFNSAGRIQVARYNSDGNLDTTFGSGGKVVTNLGGVDDAYAVRVQSDGKILVAGRTSRDATYYDIAILRYQANGTLDSTFGDAGRIFTNINGTVYQYDQASALALQPDGRLLAVGYTNPGGTDNNFALVRYLLSPSCMQAISPTSQTLAAAGGNGNVTVTTGSNCPWTATSNAIWLTITAGTSGTGTGTVTFTVAANTSSSPRTGTLTIAGQIFTVNQAGQTCPTITLAPTSLLTGTVNTAYNQTVTAAPAGSYTFAVTAGALPTGLSLNATTGAITGTPAADGNFTFTITATTGSCTGSQSYAVTINPVVTTNTIAGTVNFAVAARPVAGVLLTATGAANATSTTGSNGTYTLANLPNGSYLVTPSKTGDVNGISSFDASLVAQHVAGLITLSSAQQSAGDASNNGSLSSFDASLIAQAVAGLSNPANFAGTWKFVPGNRAYSPLSGNQTNQNFDAILVGDVSGNWAATSTPLLNPWLPSLAAQPQFESLAARVSVALAPAQTEAAGASFVVPIQVSDLTGKGLVAYDLVVTFDPTVVQWEAVEAAATLSRGFALTTNTDTPGRLVIAAFGTEALAGAGTLLKLKGRVIGAAGTATTLKWEACQFNEGGPLVTTTDSRFTVAPTSRRRPSERRR